MSVFQKTFSSGIVIYSGNNEIPSRNLIVQSVNQGNVNTLDDNTATFVTWDVRPGDVVYDIDNGVGTTVTKVQSQTRLYVEDGVLTLGNTYRLYRQSDYSGIRSAGAYIFNADISDHVIEGFTIGGDFISINMKAMSVFPVQMKKINFTNIPAGLMHAIW